MKETYVKYIDCSIFSSFLVKPIATFQELQKSQLASVIAVSKHNKERKGVLLIRKVFNYFLKKKNGEI